MPPLIEFKTAYAKLVGLTYGSLSDKQKQAVYAMAIYNDSHDALTAFDLYADERLPADFVDQHNRNTFGYTDDTIIEDV